MNYKNIRDIFFVDEQIEVLHSDMNKIYTEKLNLVIQMLTQKIVLVEQIINDKLQIILDEIIDE